MSTIYSTYEAAEQAEVIDKLEALGEQAANYDTDTIAEVVLTYDSINGNEGHTLRPQYRDRGHFWRVVEANRI